MTATTIRSGLNRSSRRLQRMVDHHRLRRGHGPLDIDALVSPLRYDILVRQRYFSFVFDHLDLFDRDFDAFVEFSRRHQYHAWFHHVAIGYVRPGARGRGEIEAAFRERVSKTVALARSFSERGFDQSFPITVRTAGATATTATGKQLAGRHYPSDGCHRLALLRASGHRQLKPEWYRILHDQRWCPPDNTHSLIPALGISRRDYVGFISLGYAREVFEHEAALLQYLLTNEPDLKQEVGQVMAVDAALFKSTS